jgi:transcriptional regulator with XRE-family HTH domain
MASASTEASHPRWTRLRARRQELGLSIRTLALRSGVDKATLWRLENGKVLPNATTVAALADALDCQPIDLTNYPPQGATEDDR